MFPADQCDSVRNTTGIVTLTEHRHDIILLIAVLWSGVNVWPPYINHFYYNSLHKTWTWHYTLWSYMRTTASNLLGLV